ncbi:MAG TPA: hypothetical protein DCY40_01285 [Actinobacteria bacterium]|nr:hypothetical protein [Actinomycetota bacterium]
MTTPPLEPEEDDFPIKVADLFEAVATRIRAMTVDRIARVITFITLGIVALALIGLAFIFLLVGLFRILDELFHKACDCGYSMEIAYAAVGGLFLLAGVLMWRRRIRHEAE